MAWNSHNSYLDNELRWMRDRAEDAEAGVSTGGYGSSPEQAARYRREADELEEKLEERRHG
jgi:hypothetical protein